MPTEINFKKKAAPREVGELGFISEKGKKRKQKNGKYILRVGRRYTVVSLSVLSHRSSVSPRIFLEEGHIRVVCARKGGRGRLGRERKNIRTGERMDNRSTGVWWHRSVVKEKDRRRTGRRRRRKSQLFTSV